MWLVTRHAVHVQELHLRVQDVTQAMCLKMQLILAFNAMMFVKSADQMPIRVHNVQMACSWKIILAKTVMQTA